MSLKIKSRRHKIKAVMQLKRLLFFKDYATFMQPF
jgi:hypothetical protein